MTNLSLALTIILDIPTQAVWSIAHVEQIVSKAFDDIPIDAAVQCWLWGVLSSCILPSMTSRTSGPMDTEQLAWPQHLPLAAKKSCMCVRSCLTLMGQDPSSGELICPSALFVMTVLACTVNTLQDLHICLQCLLCSEGCH